MLQKAKKFLFWGIKTNTATTSLDSLRLEKKNVIATYNIKTSNNNKTSGVDGADLQVDLHLCYKYITTCVISTYQPVL